MRRPWIPAAIVAGAVALPAHDALADWPMARHDAQRTGSASGTSNITQPVAYWRARLGGAVDARGAMAVDINGDGKAEIVFVGGGRAFARAADNTEIWHTPLTGISTLDAAVDLDGDGTLDIVGHSSNQVLVVNSKTGSVEWAEPIGEMGTIGGVRIADFDRDGLPDVYVQECGSCSVISGKTGFAYSFATGFGSVKRLWTAAAIAGGGQRAMTVVDVDGDSHPEITLASATAISILNGATGATIATSPQLGTSFVQFSECLPVDVDNAGGEELVCALSTSLVSDDSGHRVFVLHYSATPTPTLSVLWQHDVGEVNGGLSWGPGMVADLDGNGSLEVTVSGSSSAGATNTYVFDAASGSLLGTLLNQAVVGATSLKAPNQSVILTANGTAVSAWSFVRGAASPFTFLWSLPDHEVLTSPDWNLVRKSSIAESIVATDLSGDGLADLVTSTLGPGGTQLQAYSAAGGSPSMIGSYAFPTGVEPLQAWVVPPVDRAYPQVMLASSNGFMTVLDNKLAATEVPGVQLGGFYADGGWRHLDSEPVIADLGGQAGQAVLVTDSRGALIRLDPSVASFAVPPSKVWESEKSTGPVVLHDLDGSKPGVACWKVEQPVTNPPKYQVAALRADGTAIWIVPIEEGPVGGLLPGTLDSDAVPDLFAQWGSPTDTVLHLRGISGASGATLWNEAVAWGPNRQPAGAAAVDWDGDGRDDLIYQFYGTHIASGVDGHEIQAHADSVAYALPTLYDVDGDGKYEVTLSGTLDVARTLDDDLSTTLWQGPRDQPFPYGAMAACPGKPPRLVEGSYEYPAQLDMTDTSGPTAGAAVHVVLAGGKSYASEAAAQAAGAQLGQLTSTSVHANLTGNGRPSAVVGSSDGWLYAVNPCDATMDFAVNFGAPVGAVAFGDTDGDGLDEVLVSVADGYLYDLRQPPLPAPSFVFDTDPDHGITDADVDDILTTNKLNAKWGAVPGATGYRVAVAKADGTGYLTSPAWQDVGSVTSASVTGLPLINGARYVFAVAALAGTSPSPDTVSDGVTVHFPSDAGEDGGLDAEMDGAPDGQADAREEDGGPDTGSEAGPEASPNGTVQSSGGCGCRLSDRQSGPGRQAPLAVIAGVIAFTIRRRRRCRVG
jgi:MYXO-CTERM domain-containing protein